MKLAALAILAATNLAVGALLVYVAVVEWSLRVTGNPDPACLDHAHPG